MRRVHAKARGFTLVEVLVALVIVAVGMSALLAALGSAATNTSYLREKTFAQWVALNRVAEVRLQGQIPSKGKQSGESDFAGHKWQWEQEVSSLDVPGVMRMDVKVRMADTTPAKNAPWIGNAIGVMGDSIMRSLNPQSSALTWEVDPTVTGPGGDGKNNGSNTTIGNPVTNPDVDEPPTQPSPIPEE